MPLHDDKNIRPPLFDKRRHIRRKLSRSFIHFFVWIGIAVLFYIGFSFFFDTPLEYSMKQSTEELREQYKALNQRYDSIEQVLDNVIERDRYVFNTLFEAEPYDFASEYDQGRWISYEKLLSRNNTELSSVLSDKTSALEKKMVHLLNSYSQLEEKVELLGDAINYIPSIQPVVNPELTLLTASFGLRIHPFYKTLAAHNGVDYTVPEGSRVFATADGRVKDVVSRRSSSGLTLIISHGNGYETQYSHLSKINVKQGQAVRRGDIIALTGNSGLSLAPHLHYEVKHNGLRIDPIHYFFMELTPSDYQKMIQIARSGMQSFD